MRLANLHSKACGNAFEDMIEFQCRLIGAALTKIPSGCKWVGKKQIPVKTDFDYLISYEGRSAVFDAKTIKQSGFSYSNLTPHQVKALLGHQFHGTVAGYLIWFRGTDQVSFMKASVLKELKPKCSLKPEDGLIIGNGRNFSFRGLLHARTKTAG